MAACGVDLTVAVTEDGELLAWGHLGLGAVLTDLQVRRQRRHQTDAKGLSIWLLLVQHGAESKMAVLAVAPGKELAVLGHGDGEVQSARRHRPRPDSWDAGGSEPLRVTGPVTKS